MANRIKRAHTPNILIVDDTTSNLIILAEMIKSIGYIARPVTSVKQALSAISVNKPHLILLDISMPEVDGFEFCEMLKQDTTLSDIPIIFISALNTTEDKVKGFKLGAVDFISKPFELEEITLRINTHLKIFQMQNELKEHNKRLLKMFNDQIEQVTEDQKNLIFTLTSLMESRMYGQETHIEDMVRFTKLLALSLQFSPKFEKQVTASFIDNIVMMAPLHDVGMAKIRDTIILKEGKLTRQEREIMQDHTILGEKCLRELYEKNKSESMEMAIDIAKYHHERWDGTGYPCGLKGEEIPLSARIVSVVDVYDVLTSNTIYRKSFTHEEAIEIMKQKSGKSFDPEIMKVFLKVHNQFRKEKK